MSDASLRVPEQIKKQNICPVKQFYKGILRQLSRFDKLQPHSILFSPLRQRQRDQFRAR